MSSLLLYLLGLRHSALISTKPKMVTPFKFSLVADYSPQLIFHCKLLLPQICSIWLMCDVAPHFRVTRAKWIS